MKLLIASALLTVASLAQAAGTIPTNLEFPLVNGAAGVTTYRMADHANGVFVFESYGLSCGYCNQNAPNVDKLASDYKNNERVQVLDLSLDSNAAYQREWVKRHAPNHPVIADTGRKVYSALRSQDAIPQVFVVNCKGEMVGTILGAWDASGQKQVRSFVEKALKTTCDEQD